MRLTQASMQRSGQFTPSSSLNPRHPALITSPKVSPFLGGPGSTVGSRILPKETLPTTCRITGIAVIATATATARSISLSVTPLSAACSGRIASRSSSENILGSLGRTLAQYVRSTPAGNLPVTPVFNLWAAFLLIFMPRVKLLGAPL